MAEGEVHAHLKRLALYFLKEKCVDLVANEVDFNNAWSIADAVGLNLKRREVRVVEVKASKSDFKRDTKLFGDKTSYFHHAHYSYIMCPVDLIKSEEVPHGYGLLWVNSKDEIEVVKRPTKNTARLKTLFDTTLKRTCRALTNQMLFKDENKEHKDLTEGKYEKNAHIKFSSIRCPQCKHVTKELINKNVSMQIKCKYCKEPINTNDAKIRDIIGFNDKFIKKINELKGTEE